MNLAYRFRSRFRIGHWSVGLRRRAKVHAIEPSISLAPLEKEKEMGGLFKDAAATDVFS